MRSLNLGMLLLLAGSLGLGACAAPEAEDDADDQTQNVTGGSSAIESPVVFLFDSAASDVAPKCAGAMLSDKMAVTAKSCAKEGLLVGRAADKDGHGARARIARVHLPEARDADIAVVELEKDLKGTIAVITHMPLRGGYAVNAFAAIDGKGLFSPDKNEASTVKGSMTEETSSHGSLVPEKGSEICDGDLGAPVCSTTGGKIGSFNLYGTCGLAGLVVSRATPAVTPNAPAAGSPPVDPNSTAAKCSGGAWKVAQLGQYKDFLTRYAPKSFEPLRIDKPIIRNFPFAPEGLWGYKTKGDVKACKIETATLSATAPGGSSGKMLAKVSFAGMDKKAAAWGRFGFAKKTEPTNVRWMAAKPLGTTSGTAFDTSFEGIVAPEAAGEYLVMFRASANGGESWTSCDTDGIENGFQVDKTLKLSVVDPNAPAQPGQTPPPATETPSTPQSNDPPYSDPASTSSGETTEEGAPEGAPEEEEAPTKKKAKDDSSGCSVGAVSGQRSAFGFSALLVIGLAALVRRRRN